MCYAGFEIENSRRIYYADHATSENVLHPSRNCHRMCYAVKIRRYRPAVRTADVGKRATMITKRRKMCYAGHATSENVLRRSRNSGKCGKIKKLTLKKVRIVGPMQLHQRSQRWSVRWSDLSVALGSDRLLRSTGKKREGEKIKNELAPHGRYGRTR